METVILEHFLKSAASVTRVEHLDQNFTLQGISTDTRTLSEGELFIAIRGEKFDGHDYVGEAINKGVSAVVIADSAVHPGLPAALGVIYVQDTLQFLMEFAGWYRGRFGIPVIALTGSNGKTTTKEMMASVLSHRFKVMKTRNNENNFIGVSQTLLDMNNEGEIAVVELGTNHPGEIAALTKIVQPTHAAITNIGKGHIGFFGSRDAIYAEKRALFDGMMPESVVFLNVDDPYLQDYRHSSHTIKTFGLRKGSSYHGSLLGFNDNGCVRFRINKGPEIQLQIPGNHQLHNALLAGGIGLEFGLPHETVKEGLEGVTSPDKRMQVLSKGGILIINDAYNSNPDSLRAAIDYLCALTGSPGAHKFMVLGDMLELGEMSEQEHRSIGQYLQEKPVYYVGVLGQFAPMILEEIEKFNPGNIQTGHFETHREMADALNKMIRNGDILLIKGSRGMAMEKLLEHLETGK